MNDIIKVALADDHQLFRTGMAAILNANPKIEVIFEAANGHELLEGIKAGQQPDVILLDMEMPVMNGLQTLTALRKASIDIPVILLTMHSNDRFVLHFMESGANGYLLKDTKPQEVESAIFRVVETGMYFNDAVSRVLLKGVQQKTKEVPSIPGAEPLNEREIEVLKLICLELTTQEIADRIFLSPRTIEGYRKSLLEKTGAKNTVGLVLYAVRAGLVTG